MKVFIDFDDSLFNTKKFRDELLHVFLRNGVSRKDFLKTYYDYPRKTSKGLQKYDPIRQISILKNKIGADGSKIKRDLEKFISNSKKFVFPDTRIFFEEFRKKDLFLVSYGHTGFQDEKIENCCMRQYFRKIIVTDRMKAEIIKKFAKKNEKIVFVDDRVDQINKVKKYFPSGITFLLKRKEGRYNDKRTKYVDYEVKNLEEIGKILKRMGINKS